MIACLIFSRTLYCMVYPNSFDIFCRQDYFYEEAKGGWWLLYFVHLPHFAVDKHCNIHNQEMAIKLVSPKCNKISTDVLLVHLPVREAKLLNDRLRCSSEDFRRCSNFKKVIKLHYVCQLFWPWQARKWNNFITCWIITKPEEVSYLDIKSRVLTCHDQIIWMQNM